VWFYFLILFVLTILLPRSLLLCFTLALVIDTASPRFRYTHALLCSTTRNFSLKDDDLAGRMGLQPKELNKVIAVLNNDCLVKVCVTLCPLVYLAKN
jgi:hypothetical protein